jgi:glycosyltransferase involved in cell wall biosynthesis
MSQPLVSVIVVGYNHAKYVVECLNSLQNQTYGNWELIIADDASKDNSVEVIDKWLLENNVKATRIFHQVNKGASVTLNECLEKCNGLYIKTIAADDFMHPNLLEKSITLLEDLGEEYGMVYSNAEFVDGASKRKGKTLLDNFSPPSGWINGDLFKGNFIPALSTVIRKSAQESTGSFDPKLVVEDLDFWLRLSSKYKVAFIPETLSFYRIHGENLSLSYNISSDTIKIFIKNDAKIQHSKRIKDLIMGYYNRGVIEPEFLKHYESYKGKDGWLLWCLKNKIPYKVFRLIDKLKEI